MSSEKKTEEDEIKNTIENLSGIVFSSFQEVYFGEKDYYHLNVALLVVAIKDAFTDISRAGSYCSSTGANIFKKSAYISKRISEIKPIQIASFPINSTNTYHIDSLRINASFSIFCLEVIIGKYKLYPELLKDITYCFLYRPRMDADSYILLLEHALKKSVEFHNNIKQP